MHAAIGAGASALPGQVWQGQRTQADRLTQRDCMCVRIGANVAKSRPEGPRWPAGEASDAGEGVQLRRMLAMGK